MVSLNQIVSRIEAIADQHYFVKSFNSGVGSQLLELDQAGDIIYPVVYLEEQPASSTGGAFYFNFNLIIIDLVQDDRSNEREVKSDCLQSAIDFVTTMERFEFISEGSDAFFYPEQTVNYTFVSEQFQDRVSGVQASISIKQAFDFNRCILPLTGNVNCQAAPSCTDLINSLTVTQLNECILPNYDFSTTAVQSNVTAGQQTDLSDWLCSAASGICYSLDSYWDGQETSYQANDVGTRYINGDFDYTPPTSPSAFARLDFNDASPFFTLVDNNAFGNKNRFTNDLGGSYSDNTDGSTANYYIDHLTRRGWYMLELGGGSATWSTSVNGAASLTVGAYSDFYLASRNEILSVVNGQSTALAVLKWAGINMPAINQILWAGSTNIQTTSRAYCLATERYANVESTILSFPKTTASYYIAVRIHYT